MSMSTSERGVHACALFEIVSLRAPPLTWRSVALTWHDSDHAPPKPVPGGQPDEVPRTSASCMQRSVCECFTGLQPWPFMDAVNDCSGCVMAIHTHPPTHTPCSSDFSRTDTARELSSMWHFARKDQQIVKVGSLLVKMP